MSELIYTGEIVGMLLNYPKHNRIHYKNKYFYLKSKYCFGDNKVEMIFVNNVGNAVIYRGNTI